MGKRCEKNLKKKIYISKIIQMGNKLVKTCSLGKMEIKTKMSAHYTALRIESTDNTKYW